MTYTDFEQRVDELVALARREMEAAVVPGAQLGIVDGSDERTCFLGIADVRAGAPVDDDTMFRIASITKTFTATLLVRLASQGRLDLDDPVRRHVPEFALADRDAAERVTIRHLLLHTGGWDPHLELVPDSVDSLAVGAATQARAEQIAPPGAYFSYNGVGYMVAGRVIEVVMGVPFEDAVRSEIIEPLGLERTRFESEPAENVAADHTVRGGTPEHLADTRGARWGLPTGGLRSTARDLMRFARCHFGETQVLAAEEAAKMALPQVSLPAPRESKALSWFVRDLGVERLLIHAGGAAGQQSLLALCPRRRFAVIVLTNSGVGYRVTETVLARALELFLDIVAPPPPSPIPMSHAALEQFEGLFVHLASDVILSRDGDRLLMRLENKGPFAARPAVEPAHLDFWEKDRVVGADGFAKGQYGDFLRDASGRVAYFRWSGRARPRGR
jgi:CubicO group peptidase (beta-lactamase class C family)